MKFVKQKDIKKYREELLKLQKNKDPITGMSISRACLDHSHKDGLCRQVLDFQTNTFLGKVENGFKRYISWNNPGIKLSIVLRKMADYIDLDYNESLYHPEHLKKLCRSFNTKNKIQQIKELIKLSKDNYLFTPIVQEISPTKKGRLKQYRKIITHESEY